MFRGQRPQLLRYRQFWQWGLECYGAAEPGAGLEQIGFAAALLAEVGLTEYVLKVNTVGETAAQPKIREALKAYFERYRVELDDDCKARLDSNVLRIFDCKNPNDRKIAQGAPKLRDLVSDADKTHFAAVVDGLDRLGGAYEGDERLARGFDYYTRTGFESAVKHGAKVAVIRGTPEARGGNVIVRDLTKKVQRVTRLAAVVVEVGRHVPKRPKPRLESGPNPDEHEPGAAGEGPYLGDGEKE